jgi:hypothetical protein
MFLKFIFLKHGWYSQLESKEITLWRHLSNKRVSLRALVGWGTYATSRKVAGSITDEVTGFIG